MRLIIRARLKTVRERILFVYLQSFKENKGLEGRGLFCRVISDTRAGIGCFHLSKLLGVKPVLISGAGKVIHRQ
jgi:hypothetical protein